MISRLSSCNIFAPSSLSAVARDCNSGQESSYDTNTINLPQLGDGTDIKTERTQTLRKIDLVIRGREEISAKLSEFITRLVR